MQQFRALSLRKSLSDNVASLHDLTAFGPAVSHLDFDAYPTRERPKQPTGSLAYFVFMLFLFSSIVGNDIKMPFSGQPVLILKYSF